MAKAQTNGLDLLASLDVMHKEMDVTVLGDSPFIFNAMPEKARRELLLPKGRKTAAEKASSLKHNPLEEFRNSVYSTRDPEFPTFLVAKGVMFKKAIMGAAVDLPGAARAKLGRLIYVKEENVPIYGNPELFMSVVRSADQNRTPDVRTRAILPMWAATFTIKYTEPLIKSDSLGKLIAAAGMTQGVGDWRVEKGSGSFGRFTMVNPDEGDVELLKKIAARNTQIAAMEHPRCYDTETEQLLSWYDNELGVRGFKDNLIVNVEKAS